MKLNILTKYPKTIIITIILGICGIFIVTKNFSVESSETTEISTPTIDYISSPKYSQTITPFSYQEEFITKEIPFETIYNENENLEIGVENTLQEGINGFNIQTYLVSIYENEEYARQLINEDISEPQNEIIEKGTKIVVRQLETPDGIINYTHKLYVYSVAYTLESAGGSGYTATGTVPHYGTVAVDPSVIPLGTKMYIPGYGIGTAEDTGGAIKGNIIDLFYEGNHGWWNAKWVDIYILAI